MGVDPFIGVPCTVEIQRALCSPNRRRLADSWDQEYGQYHHTQYQSMMIYYV